MHPPSSRTMSRPADNVVYGIAASPDNSNVAILVVSDQHLGSYADLLVLDAEGNAVYRKDKAAHIPKSDGFVYVYPMAWIDEHTVVVPLYGHGDYSEGSLAHINITDDTTVVQERMVLPEAAGELLAQYIGEARLEHVSRVLPAGAATGTDNTVNYYAVELSHGGSWLLDLRAQQAASLGQSKLLHWTRDGNLLLFRSDTDHASYIGHDNVIH